MIKHHQQLALGLCLKDEFLFDNFYSGTNEQTIAKLKQITNGCGEKIIYLYGPSGAGRSHLLQACCHQAHTQQLTSVYLPLFQLRTLSPDLLIGLEAMDLVCIDDMQAIAGLSSWEEAIFHLFNRLYDANKAIIIAANTLPKNLSLHLNDLTSRLLWSVIYQLYPLNDEEKLVVLIMRASRRGMHLPEEVAKYILTHCKRHMVALFEVLEQLDKASLAAQRRLTIPFVKEVIQM